jgi:uncharacterized repeat protein (TIGR01451 family)
MQKNNIWLRAGLILIPLIVFVGIFSILLNSAFGAQNSNFPSPAQCAGADWNIGSPDGATCSSSITTGGSGRAMEADPKAAGIFGTGSRLKPDLASLNKFCQQYTGENGSYAIYGRMHRYCNGCDQNLSWWNGSSWTTNTACAGTLNVQEVKCATSCTPPAVNFISGEAPATAYIGDIIQIKCNYGSGTLPCITGVHGTANDCSYVRMDGITAIYNCTAKVLGLNNNYCNLFVYPQDQRCLSTQSHQINSTNVISKCTDHASKKCAGNTVYWYDSCGNKQELVQTCSQNQTCSNGACIDQPIACSTDAQCGTNAFTGSPFCQGNNVYQNYITYKCNSAGTPASYCSNSTVSQLKASCTANQTCSNGSCINQTIACSTNSQCGTNGVIGSPFCGQNGDVYQTYRTYTCNNPGTPQSTCSQADNNQLKTNCTANQTCSNGSCTNQTIACSTSSQCGTNAFTGSPFCQGNSIYQNYLTYTCNNAGTPTSYCSNSTAAQKKNDCTGNQICNNGSCTDQTINCSTNAQCGTNAFTGSPFCQGGDVFQNYTTHTCNNAGTPTSYCSTNTAAQLKTNCTANQTCANGSCTDQTIACTTSSQCGTNAFTGSPFCGQNGDVYQNYITYVCNNAGTATSYCSSNTASQLQNTCATNQTCQNGTCNTNQTGINISCYASPNPVNVNQTVSFICNVSGGTGTYTYSWSGACTGSSSTCTNSFSSQGTQTATLFVTSGSQTNSATASVNVNQNCSQNSYQQCNGNYLYWYDSCGNQQGSPQYCPNGCYGNTCQQNNNISVQTNSATNVFNNQATLNGYVYGNSIYGGSAYYANYVWFQWGTTTGYGNETTHQTLNSSGSFSQNVNLFSNSTTYHYRAAAQNSNGSIVYGQDMTIYSSVASGSLTVSKTVRNISNGFNWANSTSAAPGDMLMFMITVQATGNQDVQNVVVRDTLPSNLIYQNQLVVSRSNNVAGNYSGDIAYGINLNTISAGQTVTITYQAQVASAQNFAFGSTTLNNNVSITSSNSSNPTANASVFVTRTAVLGASTISTGLTNNFWVDSFFLPLLLTLLGIWMWRSGVFFGIERWLDNRRKISRGYKAERELNSRIAQIRKAKSY